MGTIFSIWGSQQDNQTNIQSAMVYICHRLAMNGCCNIHGTPYRSAILWVSCVATAHVNVCHVCLIATDEIHLRVKDPWVPYRRKESFVLLNRKRRDYLWEPQHVVCTQTVRPCLRMRNLINLAYVLSWVDCSVSVINISGANNGLNASKLL